MKKTLQECKEIVAEESPMLKGTELMLDLANKMYYEQSEWIRVEDRLPDGFWSDTEQDYYKRYSQQVNVFVDNSNVGTAAYNRETKKWFTGDLSKERYLEFELTKVTHWMPLPSKPQFI